MIKLKGMTWKHERGLKPLVEASRIFAEKNNVQIDWDARSLSDFELFPLDELANKYDLIMIDHPHIGIAHEQNLLQPLEKLLSKEMLQEQENGSVGKSYQSYFWEGHQYAIPLDAATQVSAFRKDFRITSYNVCYTKLLRCSPKIEPPVLYLLNAIIFPAIGKYLNIIIYKTGIKRNKYIIVFSLNDFRSKYPKPIFF